jgi:hypothetical protein
MKKQIIFHFGGCSQVCSVLKRRLIAAAGMLRLVLLSSLTLLPAVRGAQATFPWTTTTAVPPGCPNRAMVDDTGAEECAVTKVFIILNAAVASIEATAAKATSKLEMTLIWTDTRATPWIPSLIFEGASKIVTVSESAPVPFKSRGFKDDDQTNGTPRLFQQRVLLVTHRTSNSYRTFPFDSFVYDFTIGMETDMNGIARWVDVQLISSASDQKRGEGRTVVVNYDDLVTDGYYVEQQTLDDTTFGVLKLSYRGARDYLPYIYKVSF